jgi:XTP/dITP diphosphohydrolase
VPLLIATTNKGKLAEIGPLLEGLDFELITLADLAPVEAPDENGLTFEENARLKAQHYAAATGLPTVAEDSGLEVDGLDGAPGVLSSRFGGVDSTYTEKFALIYSGLRARGLDTCPARFVCAVALVSPSVPNQPPLPHLTPSPTLLFEARGTIEGTIATSPAGDGGFGYDPIFYYPPFGCTLAEAEGRKSSVSHRGQAFRALRAFLQGTPELLNS